MEDTKQKLATSLKELMQSEAVDHITVNQLTDYAKVSRNTFYYHFVDIHETLTWIYDHEVIAQLDDYQNQRDWGDGLLKVLNYIEGQITSLIRTSPESFNGSLLMMYF